MKRIALRVTVSDMRQNNACANKANAGGQTFTVSDCNTQQRKCSENFGVDDQAFADSPACRTM